MLILSRSILQTDPGDLSDLVQSLKFVQVSLSGKLFGVPKDPAVRHDVYATVRDDRIGDLKWKLSKVV